MQLIPAIDLKDGQCVRLLRGNFDAETRYDADPLALLRKYAGYGARWLHVVDLDGAKDGNQANRAILFDLARAPEGLELQVGGGMRNPKAIADMLGAGVSRVVIGSAAVTDPQAVRAWIKRFGAERIVLAFDVRLGTDGTPRLAIHGWREQSEISLWSAVTDFAEQGLKHVLCTDVSRDGALTGPNVALYAEAVRRHPGIQWQASGGVAEVQDLRALEAAGASAAVSGKALLEELIPLEELAPFLPNA